LINLITFEKQALEDYSNWAIENKSTFNKINKLIKSIQRTPFEGEGKPEALKHELSSYWSRKITGEHRLIYKVESDQIIIAQCKGHY